MSRSRIALGIAGLPGVLLFLASVGTASAECAWVLWDNEWSLERSFWERWVERDTSKWVVSDAFEKKQECERAKEEKLRAPWNQLNPEAHRLGSTASLPLSTRAGRRGGDPEPASRPA